MSSLTQLTPLYVLTTPETYCEKFLKKVKKARQDKQTNRQTDILKIYISKIRDEDVIVHPEYRKTTANIINDIALIRLPRLAEINGTAYTIYEILCVLNFSRLVNFPGNKFPK